MASCNKVGIYFSPTLVFFLALDLGSKKHVLCEEKQEAACIYGATASLGMCQVLNNFFNVYWDY
jgi:hypothetical protein